MNSPRGELFLDLPTRPPKPREQGLTVVIDTGLPFERFRTTVESHHEYIDYIKLGWCTGVLSGNAAAKIELARRHGIETFFGGTFFEAALRQGRLAELRRYIREAGCTTIEISNGSILLSNRDKARHITDFRDEFTVFSEVGYKDTQRSLDLHPARWIEYMEEDLEAGARYVITEARESGRAGICRSDGEVRYGLIQEILNSALDSDKIIFEAPTKSLQVYFIELLRQNVNLANIAPDDIIPLETLRLGLRGDTINLYGEGEL